MIKLIHGDCLEEMDKLIEQGVKVDAIITNPPYVIVKCKWDNIINVNEMWKHLKLLRKDKSPIVLFGSEPFSSTLRMSNIKEFKYDWIWQKTRPTGFFTAKKMPMKIHEIISVFYKKQCTYNPLKTKADPTKIDKRKTLNPTYNPYLKVTKDRVPDDGMRYPLSIQKIPSLSKKGQHPTQKPVKLLEYLIKTYTNENDLVLDFTMGSFTTAIACLNTRRNFIGIELDDKYFTIGKNRVESHIKTLDYKPEIIYIKYGKYLDV